MPEMSDAERCEKAADALCDVDYAMDDVDLNTLDDEDAYAFLEYKLAIREMLLEYRQNQQAAEGQRERNDCSEGEV